MSLKIEKLSKRIEDRWILRDVTFSVEKGEIFGIFSVNGNGKTTLLQQINQLNKANLMFPNKQKKSGLKGIFSNSKRKKRSIQAQIESLETVLNTAEKVLLLDNPLVKFDAENKREIAEKLKRTTREKGLSVVLATNDEREVFEICDKVGILHQGEIVQIGTPQEVYLQPKNVAVAKCFGENNLINARRLNSNNDEIPEFFTIQGEHKLNTDKTDKQKLSTINQTVTLAIRPEHISIAFGASFPEDNLIKAKITEINFRGSTTLIKLDANGLELKALVLRLVGLNIGDECMVGLPPDRILVLKD